MDKEKQEWTDELVHHLLVMAYMSGWVDRDTESVDRQGSNGFVAVGKQKAYLAIASRKDEYYL